MILKKIFIVFDFPVPLLIRTLQTTTKTSEIHREDSNLPLLPINWLLKMTASVSVYLEPKKHLKESVMVFKVKHSRVTKTAIQLFIYGQLRSNRKGN